MGELVTADFKKCNFRLHLVHGTIEGFHDVVGTPYASKVAPMLVSFLKHVLYMEKETNMADFVDVTRKWCLMKILYIEWPTLRPGKIFHFPAS